MARDPIYTGGGSLYFRRKNTDGTYEPMILFGRTDGITLNASVEFIEQENTEGMVPTLATKLPKKSTSEIKFGTYDVTVDTLSYAFMGNKVEQSQTAGTNVEVAISGDFVGANAVIPTGIYNGESLVLTDDGGSTTYVEGTDYSINYGSGFITILDGSAIVAGAALKATFGTVPAKTINIVAAMKTSGLTGEFRVVTSSQTGNDYIYIVKEATVVMDGEFMLKGNEVGNLQFVGSALSVGDACTGNDLSNFIDIIEIEKDAC